ncbi:MAG: twin-arginine translocase subunit TatC [Anaerolineaceae bacterium]|nr:twin-arginine translocase subunit TatC [Anaerolineaceae bacterium]
MPEEKQLTAWGHLAELRSRLFRVVLALAVTTILSFVFAEKLMTYLAMPIGGLDKLVSIEVTENVSVYMKVSLLSGVILAFPFVLYQLLAFTLPGLLPAERYWVLGAIPLATVFFLSGVAFAYFVMLPTALPFLVSFTGIRTMPRPNNYFNFVTGLLFWVGIAFETPLLIFILAKVRIVSASMLAKQWRIAIVLISVLAAVISPTPDPVNMGLLMIPLSLLYGLSILFAAIARRSERPSKETAPGSTA